MIACNVELNQRDVDDFCKALDAYVDTRKDKSYHYCLNRAAKDVAARAAQFTHHADDAKLRAMLGQPAREVNPKTGRYKRSKARHTNDAGAILAGRMAKAGKSARVYSASEWHKKVALFVGRTLASINFMRAGWLPAYKILATIVKQGSGVGQEAAFGRQKEDQRGMYAKHPYPTIGGAIPARDVGEDVLAVEIWNAAVNPRNKTSWSEGLGKYGVLGLEKAIAFKANDLMVFVEEAADKRAQDAGLA